MTCNGLHFTLWLKSWSEKEPIGVRPHHSPARGQDQPRIHEFLHVIFDLPDTLPKVFREGLEPRPAVRPLPGSPDEQRI